MKYWLVDAFRTADTQGNPAAVFLLGNDIDDAEKQKIATDLGLSETVFILPRDKDDAYPVRWFTPHLEVFLCGHGTLATAHVFWEEGLAPRGEPIRFLSRSGPLSAEETESGVRLNFPLLPGEPRADYLPVLSEITGQHVREAQSNGEYVIARVDSEEAVRACRPDLKKMMDISEPGFIVTAAPAAQAGSDYVYRVFCPKEGIDEDPVTGSAQTILAPFWRDRLRKACLSSFQASSRGGRMVAEPLETRVLISGKAVTVARKEWTPPALP